MCGIFGAISNKNIYGEMKPALERLSYRGYDSAGIAATVGEDFSVIKCVGHPEALDEIDIESFSAIGHNRWATHGLPTEDNAHPHLSNDNSIALVHNGIIENYLDLKAFLVKEGFSFRSDTDTEVIPNLIQFFYQKNKDLLSAVRSSFEMIHGAYAIVFMHKDYSDSLFVAKLGSPICIGRAKDATYISSDINSLPMKTEKAAALEDNRFIQIFKDGTLKTTSLSGDEKDLSFEKVNMQKDQYSLGEYGSYLEKEIHEQVIYSKNVIAGRALLADEKIKLSGISEDIDNIINADEIIFTGCGSAYLAAQIGAYAMETLARKRCRTIPAGELKYFNAVMNKKTAMISVSQSGETADTLGCIKTAKDHGALTLGIVNVPNSSIAREVSSGIHIRAGQEISVASTKAVTNQILSMISLAALTASKRDLSKRAYLNIIKDLHQIPDIIQETLKLSPQIKEVSKLFADKKSLLCIGRDVLEPVAKECALKVKEISYIHAEGYSASELKHGPLALISKEMPTIAFGSAELLEDKLLSNIMEIKSREGMVIAVLDDKCSSSLKDAADHVIITPSLSTVCLSVIPKLVVGQLFALHLAELNGRAVDRPRNLAKSVTVE